MELMEIRRRLIMLGGDKLKTVTINIQNACTTGAQLMAEIRAVIPTEDFVAINTIPAATLKQTANSICGVCYLNYLTGGNRADNGLMIWSANYWHTVNTSSTVDVPAGTVFKALIIDYNW